MSKELMLKEFKQITDDLLKLDLNLDTDDLIEKIEELLDKRESLLESMIQSNVTFDQEVINDLSLMDFQLKSKFEEIRLGISNEIQNVKTEKKMSSIKKKAHKGYMNLGHQSDGYFIDNKK